MIYPALTGDSGVKPRRRGRSRAASNGIQSRDLKGEKDLQEFNPTKFAIALRIRVAFAHTIQHTGGDAGKSAELLITKLESDELLLSLLAQLSLKEVLREVLREVFTEAFGSGVEPGT
jgi:hypothetical protein